MAKRLFSVPEPLSGDEDWLFVSFCIPDTPDWRRLIVGHIETVTYGRAYDEQTGYIKDALDVGREIFATMSMCRLEDLVKQQRLQTAAMLGEAVDLTDPAQLTPDQVDYSGNGLSVRLTQVNTTLGEIRDALQNLDLDDLSVLAELGNINTTLGTFDLDDLSVLGELTNLQQLSELANINTTLDELDATVTIPEMESINQHLAYLQHLQILGAIPGAGDTIQKTLWDIRDGMTGEMTLDDMIAAMIEKRDEDPDGYTFKDWLEMLVYIKQLWPNAGGSLLSWVLAQYRALLQARHAHTHSTLMAWQTTELRGIRNALAPFEAATDGEGNVTEDEESMAKKVLSELDRIPWITMAIGALVEPTPAGETAMAVRVALTIKNWWDRLSSLYSDWMASYINQVDTLQPRMTVAGMLGEMSKRLRGDNEDYGTTGQPATLFGALQTLAWTQVSPQDEINTPGISTSNQLKVIADALAALDADMPEGETWPALMGQIAANIANIKLSCSCSCGGSGCGGCGGGSEPPPPPKEAGDEPPPGWDYPRDDQGEIIPPGSVQFNERECKVANLLHKEFKEFINEIRAIEFWGVGLDTIGTLLGAAWLIVVRTILLAKITGRFVTLGEGVAGWLDELAQSLIEYGVDLDELYQMLLDNEEDLVCAFYSTPGSNFDKVDAYAQVLIDAGGSTANDLVVKTTFGVGSMALTFAKDNIEAKLDGYEGPVDCSVCGCTVYTFESDAEGWVYEDVTYPAEVSGTHQAGQLSILIQRATANVTISGQWVKSFGVGEYTANPGDTVSMCISHDKPLGLCSGARLIVSYDDDTTETTSTVDINDTERDCTITLTLTQAKGIKSIAAYAHSGDGCDAGDQVEYLITKVTLCQEQ